MTNAAVASGRTVLQRARAGLDGEPTTVAFSAVGVVSIGQVEVRPDDEVIDLDGRTVLPGLWDHHVHFDQWTKQQHWLDLSGAASAIQAARLVADQLTSTPPDPGLPLIGYGFRDGLWPDRPHRRQLDDVTADLPLVMVSGDLHQGWLNTAALRLCGLPSDHDGVLQEHDWFPHQVRLCLVPDEVSDRWTAESAGIAAARGVVGVVDYENTDGLTAWPRRHRNEPLRLRVRTGVWPQFLDRAIELGLRSGDPLPGTDGLVTLGNLKVISDGSLNTRTAYCYDPYPGDAGAYGVLSVGPAELVPLMRRAWQHGIGCSIHAIGDHANRLVLDAFAEVGAKGAVEHAQLLADGDAARFAALGVAASVQPEHAHDDRDVADRLWTGRTGRSFPYGELHRRGATLLLGSDSPVAPLDPLLTVGAAISRSRDGRPAWHPEHELPLEVAVAASTAVGRVDPRAGDPADLTIVDDDFRTAGAERLRHASVAGTVVAGAWTHRAGI